MPKVKKKMAEGVTDSASGVKVGAKMSKPVKRTPASRKMSPPFPRDSVMTDFSKKTSWVLGVSIGKGGFGEIYSASKSSDLAAGDHKEYVIKIVS